MFLRLALQSVITIQKISPFEYLLLTYEKGAIEPSMGLNHAFYHMFNCTLTGAEYLERKRLGHIGKGAARFRATPDDINNAVNGAKTGTVATGGDRR